MATKSDKEIGQEASSAARSITVKAYEKQGYTPYSYAENMVELTKAKYIYKGKETDLPDNKIILPAVKQTGADLGLQAPREHQLTLKEQAQQKSDSEIAQDLRALLTKGEKRGESPEEE